MIHSYRYCAKKIGSLGRVVEVFPTFVKAEGLKGAVVNEGIAFATGEHGQVISFDGLTTEILVFSRKPVSAGTRVARTGEPISVSVGEGLLGHTIDAFGYAKDERRFKSDFPEERYLLSRPLGIERRQEISKFFATGVPLVDLLLPLGFGQRELIVGDRKIGKTHFLLQVMLTQASAGRVCVYAAIGKKKEEIKKIEKFTQKYGIEKRCVIVAADANDSCGEVFLAPFCAVSVAEYFRDKGTDVLLILDDLTTHAKYYREYSLIGRRFPGRESYPGDIFHIQAQLMERSGLFIIGPKKTPGPSSRDELNSVFSSSHTGNPARKIGEDLAVGEKTAAITCLPVAETVGSDITGYIQTNLMAMTDGHLFFDNDYFYKGIRPAINPFLSVTRVGRQTQTPLARDVGIHLVSLMKKYENLQRFINFGPELGDEAQIILRQGEALIKFFNQIAYFSVATNLSLVLAGLIWVNMWDGQNTEVFERTYNENEKFKNLVDGIIGSAVNLDDLTIKVKNKSTLLLNSISKYEKVEYFQNKPLDVKTTDSGLAQNGAKTGY